jgi:large subunit ribosomal protein L29
MARDTAELRARSDEELTRELDEAHHALFNLRFQAATGQLADVAQVRNARRRIARIKTLLREREILAVADAAAGAGSENEA